MKITFLKLCLISLVVMIASCKPWQRDAAFAAADAACIAFEGMTDSKTVKKICATADELKPFVKYVLRARAAKASKTPGNLGSAPDADVCSLPPVKD